jgi:hypothetical protein
MLSWLPNRKYWNCKMQYHFIKSNLKRNNYNFMKVENKKNRKEIKRMRGDYECEGERGKNEEREGKKILFIPRTRIIYIMLYRSGRVERILKILTSI